VSQTGLTNGMEMSKIPYPQGGSPGNTPPHNTRDLRQDPGVLPGARRVLGRPLPRVHQFGSTKPPPSAFRLRRALQLRLNGRRGDVHKKGGSPGGLRDADSQLMLYLLHLCVQERTLIRALSIRTLILADGLESQGLTIVSPRVRGRRRAPSDVGSRLNE